MRKCVWLLLAALLLATPALAEDARVTADGFSFAPPEGFVQEALDADALAGGVVYAAHSADGAVRMLALARQARRSAGASLSELLGRLDERKNASLEGSVTADGTEFALATERLSEGGESLCFRTAAAVRDGRQLFFFFVDRADAGGGLPAQVASSVRWDE